MRRDTRQLILERLAVRPHTCQELWWYLNHGAHWPTERSAIATMAYNLRKKGLIAPPIRGQRTPYQLTEAGRAYVGRVRCPHCGKALE